LFPVIVGLNHRTAPVEIREKVSFPHYQIENALLELKSYPALEGVVILNTCNRLEIYAATTDVDIGLNSIKSFLVNHAHLEEQVIFQHLYIHTLYDAVRHLFRVVSGLDSMILGETQILGQVAQAYEKAVKTGVTNKVINVFFQNALTLGKRVRTETQIDQHPTSISYTAVELAKQTLGDLTGRSILILGAGEMSALTVKHLVANGASTVMVSNRSHARAQSLAEEFHGIAVTFDQLDECMQKVDIVISATAAANFVIMPERIQEVMEHRNYRPLLLVDIAVPRDIHPDVSKIPEVTLYDIDDLREVIDTHRNAREIAGQKAESIIEEEMEQFMKWHNSLFVIPTIMAFQRRGEEIKNYQLEHALSKLGGLTDKQEKVIRSMANSIVNQLLHTPITNLKEFATTRQGHLYTEILQNLFSLEVDEEAVRSMRSVHPNNPSQVKTKEG
jgi:glutamyl-tRNA reductase